MDALQLLEGLVAFGFYMLSFKEETKGVEASQFLLEVSSLEIGFEDDATSSRGRVLAAHLRLVNNDNFFWVRS